MDRPEPVDAAPASVEDLFRSHYGPMVRLAHVLTGSNVAAEDLVQDCFARLYQRWDRTTKPGAYLRSRW